MSASWGIPPNPPNVLDEDDIEVEDEDVIEDDEKELILDEPRITEDPESMPSKDPPFPPSFIPDIIFFIMSSISNMPVKSSFNRFKLLKTNNIFFRKFVREFKMPEGVLHDQISSSYSSDGILTISAPRVINAPGESYS